MTNNERSNRPTSVTREELFRQVWETPITQLAIAYGISGRGLAKICDRLKVPYPPRGHWAKKSAGKRVTTAQLPAADHSIPASVTISPTGGPTSPPSLPPAIQQKLSEAYAKTTTVLVPERLVKPHPIVARWIADHKRRKELGRYETNPWLRNQINPDPFTAQSRRRYRILNALFKELESNGGKVKEDSRKELFVEMSGERVEFQLREKQRQVRQPLTPDERRFRLSADRDWKMILEGTGRLIFTIKTYLGSGLRKEWLETEPTPMESLLPEIVATLVGAGAVLAQKRREREEAERLRTIEERKRAEERERRNLDDNRWRRFTELAQAWHTATATREFIAVLKTMPIHEQEAIAGQSSREWINWAEARLGRADPITYGINRIFRDIADVRTWTFEK